MRHERTLLLAAAGVAACCILLFTFGFFHYRLTDGLYSGKASPDIVIVGIDDESLQHVGRWPWDRRNFSTLIDRLDGSALIGVDVAFLEPSSPDADAALARSLEGKPAVLVSEYTGFDSSGRGTALLKPVAPISAASGYANIVADRDGIVRSVNLAAGDEPAFSAMLYERYTGTAMPREERYLINFARPGSYARYSAGDVIAGEVPSSAFAGKIVLVGATAPDFHDEAIVPTSGGKPMPGVEIHANALQTMLTGTELHTAPWWLGIIMIIVAAAITFLLVRRFHALLAGALALALIIAYVVIVAMLFETLILDVFYVPFTVILSFITLVTIDLMHERKQRRRVADAFGRYVSPALLERIMHHDIELGGERRELTILFSDVRGFTSISERLTPEELVEFLNSYFTRVTRIIMEEHGLVDKFIGDAVMAFWNAPLDVKDHADRAAASALAMRDALESIRAEHGSRFPRIDVGIGINTGDAVVGNVGSNERLSYTAIGDSVNLASRLEGLTKEYGVQIIISEHMRRKLTKPFVLRELDRVKVKGKKEPVTIHELVGKEGSVPQEDLRRIAEHGEALKLYYAGEFRKARDAFGKLDDAASRLMLTRCDEFIASPPHGWDGAYTMTHK